MSSVVISGDTSGSVVVAAPAVAGTNTLTLQAATATSAVNTLGTAVASTSGTSIDFTGLPSWIKRITVMFQGVSTNGVTAPQIQIGSSTFVTSGYLGAAMSGAEVTNNASGFLLNSSTFIATGVLSGGLMLSNLSGNIWVAYGSSGRSDIARGFALGGVLTTLAGALDRVRITTVNGTDVFDAGSVNILYEG